MFFLNSIKFIFVLFSICHCIKVEIYFKNVNESQNVTLFCGPQAGNINLIRNSTVLWNGRHFGVDERQKLAETMEDNALVPKVEIISSKRHKCYLLAGGDANKNRVSRKSSKVSVPSENGVCPPGHRIDGDRCFPCFPGSYTSGQESVCHLCPKDFYMDISAADACWPCPKGGKTLAEGADSEEFCVDLDETGHPLPPQNQIGIYIIILLVSFIIMFIWILFVLWWIFYWRYRNKDDSKQPGEKSGRGSRSSKPLLKQSDSGSNRYESASDIGDSDDHLYAEIGDFDDYEVPRKPSDDYEMPRKPADDYEEPRKPGDDYEKPRKSGDDYEGPRKPPFKPDDKARTWKTALQPKKGSVDDHIYESLSSDDHIYEAPIPRKADPISEDDYLQPIKKVGSEPIYDDVMYITVETEARNPSASTCKKNFKSKKSWQRKNR